MTDVQQAVEIVIEENPDVVYDYHNGEGGVVNFLVGQVMEEMGGAADPGAVDQLVRDTLERGTQ